MKEKEGGKKSGRDRGKEGGREGGREGLGEGQGGRRDVEKCRKGENRVDCIYNNYKTYYPFVV